MAGTKSQSFFKTIQPYLPYIVIGGVVLFAGSALWHKIFGGDNPNQQQAQATLDETKKEIDSRTSAGQTPSYSDARFKQYADTLEAAMIGTGTDEDAIYRVINSMNTALDLYKLTDAFGLRDYEFLLKDYGKLNLGQWFTLELSADEINQVNQILCDKGIK